MDADPEIRVARSPRQGATASGPGAPPSVRGGLRPVATGGHGAPFASPALAGIDEPTSARGGRAAADAIGIRPDDELRGCTGHRDQQRERRISALGLFDSRARVIEPQGGSSPAGVEHAIDSVRDVHGNGVSTDQRLDCAGNVVTEPPRFGEQDPRDGGGAEPLRSIVSVGESRRAQPREQRVGPAELVACGTSVPAGVQEIQRQVAGVEGDFAWSACHNLIKWL